MMDSLHIASSNISSSDDSDGGAPLYPDKGKGPASGSNFSKESSADPTKPSPDDELALVRASADFGDLNKPNDPFTDTTPQVPRSVPPMSNPYRQHVDFPGNNGHGISGHGKSRRGNSGHGSSSMYDSSGPDAHQFRGSMSSNASQYSSIYHPPGINVPKEFYQEVSWVPHEGHVDHKELTLNSRLRSNSVLFIVAS